MRENPVRFKCPACGVDASQFVDSLVRRETGQSSAPIGTPIDVLSGVAATVPIPTGVILEEEPVAQPVRTAVRMPAPAPVAVAPQQGTMCLKHPGQIATEKCYVCSKPICPKCMELFGYLCSPLCKAKADSHGITVPVYEHQKSVVEAKLWRKVTWIGGSAGAVVAVVLGVWFWYAWFGCMPRAVFSLRFPERAYSGQSSICGKAGDEIVFLHGDELARYGLKTKKPVWSVHLLDVKEFEAKAQAEIKSMAEANVKIRDNGGEGMRIPPADKLVEEMMQVAEEAMTLYVRGENIWVGTPGKLTRYAWDSGKQVKELTVQAGFGGLISRGDELMMVDSVLGKPMVTRVNLTNSECTTEEVDASEAKLLASNAKANAKPQRQEMAGLPRTPGKDMGKPLDPAKVASEASHLSLPERIALPATIGSVMTQNRDLSAMDDDNTPKTGGFGLTARSSFSVLPTKDGFVEFGAKLVESHIVQRSAMKAAPTKSALEGNVSAGKSLEVANEFLNEMQRERGGDVVQEDLSRYQVTLKRPGSEDTWTGEVTGPPKLFPLDTVNVLTSSKTVMVFDKNNKKLWQSSLAYDVVRGLGALDEDTATYGLGPCVEHKGSLYVFDAGVLTAFDLATGNVRWRLPSIGIVGLFFDEQGDIYVNTSTASPDTIKYSRQIDISDKVHSQVMKVDARRGSVLWSVEPGGLVNHVYGNVVLVAQSYQPIDEDNDGPAAGFMTPAHLRIRRISARNGKEVWEYFQQRAPLDIGFEKNTIRLVFRKEVQVLKFATF